MYVLDGNNSTTIRFGKIVLNMNTNAVVSINPIDIKK